jgi:hypothetical protein
MVEPNPTPDPMAIIAAIVRTEVGDLYSKDKLQE